MRLPLGRGAAAGLALPALLLAAGCATVPPAATPAGLLSGRLALQVEAGPERAAQSLSAGFELRGDAQHGELRLSTPLGTTLAAAAWSPDETRLVTPQGERRFEDLDALSLAAFGESLPLRALPDWLRGRPWPGAPSTASQPAPGFTQLGWRIDLAGYDAGRVLAQRAAAPAVRLRVQLDAAP